MEKQQWIIKILSGASFLCIYLRICSGQIPNLSYTNGYRQQTSGPFPSYFINPNYNSAYSYGYTNPSMRSTSNEEELLNAAQQLAMVPLSNVISSVPMIYGEGRTGQSPAAYDRLETGRPMFYNFDYNNGYYNYPYRTRQEECPLTKGVSEVKPEQIVTTVKPVSDSQSRQQGLKVQRNPPWNYSTQNLSNIPNGSYNYRNLFNYPYVPQYGTPEGRVRRNQQYSWYQPTSIYFHRTNEIPYFVPPTFNRFYNRYF